MGKSAIQAAGWVLVGMMLMGLIVWFTMPSLMLIKHKSNRSYDETIAVLSETLKKKQDWRVLAVHDYQKTTADFGAMDRVGSLNICNPRYASTAVLRHSCPWGLASTKTRMARYMSRSSMSGFWA